MNTQNTAPAAATHQAPAQSAPAIPGIYLDPKNNEADRTMLTRLDEAASAVAELAPETAAIGTSFLDAIRVANAVALLKSAIPDKVIDSVASLRGTKLGFLTDGTQKSESKAAIKDAIIAAAFMGVPLVRNCFNILGGNFYLTREGVTFKLDRIPGLRYEITPATPIIVKEPTYDEAKRRGIPGTAECHVAITWERDGEHGDEARVFAVKVNTGMTTEAIQGKAWTRGAKWLFTRLSGYDAPVTDGAEEIEAKAERVESDTAATAAKKHTGMDALKEALNN